MAGELLSHEWMYEGWMWDEKKSIDQRMSHMMALNGDTILLRIRPPGIHYGWQMMRDKLHVFNLNFIILTDST